MLVSLSLSKAGLGTLNYLLSIPQGAFLAYFFNVNFLILSSLSLVARPSIGSG